MAHTGLGQPLEQLADAFIDAVVKRLDERGYAVKGASAQPPAGVSSDYDAQTCRAFVDPRHIGDTVLERAAVFFSELEQNGHVVSIDLVAALNLKGATSLAAALTNALKKSANRLGLAMPWQIDATPDGTRTIWRDRDGIAARMVAAIADERAARGLTP
jgi:hypothetical protein